MSKPNNKSLPNIRISQLLKSNMEFALSELNKSNLVSITMQDFRRLAYELLSQMVLQHKQIPIEVLKSN